MKIKISYIDNDIIFESEKVTVLEIKNKKYFYRTIKDFYQLSNNIETDDILVLDDENKEINIKGKIKIFLDYFDLNLDSKKYINDILKFMEKNIEDEAKDEITKSYEKLVKSVKRSIGSIDLPLNIDAETSLENIFKSLKISLMTKENMLDNLIILLDLLKLIGPFSILVFVNLSLFLSIEETKELYKYAIYNEIKIIIIEASSSYNENKYVKKLIIDTDLEEYMI